MGKEETKTYEDVDRLLFEQLITSEFEGSLEEISSSGRSETSEESAGTLTLDDLLEAADEALVVLDRVELDTCFYTRGGEGVSDATSNFLTDAAKETGHP